MKVKKSVGGPLPYVIATICSGVLSVLTGPAGLVVLWPLFFVLAKVDIGREMDKIVENDSRGVIDTWQRNKRYDEASIMVSKTINTGSLGAPIGLPVTRKYKSSIDKQ